jgi:hypothetical protein
MTQVTENTSDLLNVIDETSEGNDESSETNDKNETNVNIKAKKKLQEYKSDLFKNNIVDPTNGRIVKSIYGMKITKLNREKWDLIWQVYRDRKRMSVADLFKKNKNKRMRIIYSGDPVQYYIGTEPFHNKSRVKRQSDEIDLHIVDDNISHNINDDETYAEAGDD